MRDRPLAEELFQDVWQRLIHARAGWKPEAAFATWLFRIAHNRLNDHWRAARHRPAAPDDADERTAHAARLAVLQKKSGRCLWLALDANGA